MSRTRKRERPPAEKLAPVPNEILDQFARDRPLSAAEVEAATRRFKKALIERALGAELSHHLGYPPGGAKPDAATNHRNGSSGKTVITDDGTVDIAVPRDRDGTFEPQLIPKHDGSGQFLANTTATGSALVVLTEGPGGANSDWLELVYSGAGGFGPESVTAHWRFRF